MQGINRQKFSTKDVGNGKKKDVNLVARFFLVVDGLGPNLALLLMDGISLAPIRLVPKMVSCEQDGASLTETKMLLQTI